MFLVWIKSFDYRKIGVSEGWSETFATFALIENPKTSKVKTFVNILNSFLLGMNLVLKKLELTRFDNYFEVYRKCVLSSKWN